MPTPLSISHALAALTLATLTVPVFAQGARNGTGAVAQRYAELCANCHGKNLEGAQGPSLLKDTWVHGGDDESIAKSIRSGFPEKGMPPWGAALPEKDVRAMVIFIHEMRAENERGHIQFIRPVESLTAKSELHTFQLHTWIGNVNEPWSLAFLSGGKAVFGEKRGKLWLTQDGKVVGDEIKAVPTVDTAGQAGLFDVVPHPKYAENGWLYLAFADPRQRGAEKVSLTKLIRGKIKDGALVEQQTIFEAPLDVYPSAGGVHFGGRIAFDRAGYLFFTIGERGTGPNAQNLAVPMGKVHRIFDDGRIPDDNPFAKQTNVDRTIWSYGHRNPQGLAYNSVTGQLFDVEHGPRGGDEVNLVRPGLNYGWPIITYGMDYNGQPMPTSVGTEKEGMEQPLKYWVPSIAPCGSNFYTGKLFPKWQNQLFVAALGSKELHRVEINGGKAVADEVVLKGASEDDRMREVIGGPDGALYVLFRNRIARISPVE
jgi:glucose/arabinose dehydrogenase